MMKTLLAIDGSGQSEAVSVSFYEEMEKDARERAHAAVILDRADAFGADLIVVGSHGQGNFERFLLGSVSQAVALHLKCSVEIVHSPKAGFGIVLPLLPYLIERLLGAGVQAAQVSRHTGLLTALYTFSLFLFAPLWGRLSDRRGPRGVLLLGLVGFGVITLGVLARRESPVSRSKA